MKNIKFKNYKDLFWQLVKTNFKLRYNNSILGFIWVLIKPFATFAVLYFVWTAFRGQNVENFQVKLLLGIILFTFVNEAVIFGMNGLLDKAHIILKVNFPREIAVASSVTMAVINLLINLGIYIIFSFFNPVNITFFGVAWFLITLVTALMIVYGLSLYTSIIIIRLRDMQHITELLFTLLFWATPIFYEIGNEIGQVGGTVGKIISLNPLGWLINISKEALINGEIARIFIYNFEISSVWIVLAMLIFAIFLIVTGRMYFVNEVKKVAEYF